MGRAECCEEEEEEEGKDRGQAAGRKGDEGVGRGRGRELKLNELPGR